MLVYLSQILLVVGVFMLAVNIFQWFFAAQELKKTIKRRLKSDVQARPEKSPFLRVFNVLLPLNRQLTRRFLKNRENLEARLFGARAGLTVEQFFAVKETAALLIFFIGIGFLPKDAAVNIVFIVIGGFFLPDLWLNMKLNQRKAAVVRSLPDTVDLLALCVDAGLDFVAATRWIVEKSASSAFIEELSFMLHEIKVGKPRSEALKDLARRINAPDVMAFSRTLIQADRMGTPIAEALAILSEDVRERYFRRAERIALQAPMKMLIPLIFFILPVVGVIVGGPIAIQFMQGNLLQGIAGGPKM